MKLKNLLKELYGKITGFYNYGKNNKIVFIKNGKKQHRIFMPKGLTVIIEQNNSNIEIELPVIFENTLINLEGNYAEIKIKKDCIIKGAKLYVSYKSAIYIGKNCHLNQRNLVMIANGSYNGIATIEIGNGVFAGRNCLIRTSDGHTLIDKDTKQALNPSGNVIIGDNVWITSNCTILKGSEIKNNSIIGACSMVNKKFDKSNIIIAGTPAKVIRENIDWDKRGYGKYMREDGRTIEENLNNSNE